MNESFRSIHPRDELSMHFESENSMEGSLNLEEGEENGDESNYSPMKKTVSSDIRGLAFPYDVYDDSIIMFDLDYGSIVVICMSILSFVVALVGYAYSSFCFTKTLVVIAVFTVLNIILSWIVLFKVHLSHKYDENSNKIQSNISKFDNCLYLQFIYAFWGIVVGYLGIGGTLIVGPLMYRYVNLNPQVRGSTYNTMIFYGATCGLLYYIVKGMIYYDWAMILGAISLISDYSAKSIFEGIGKKIGSRRFLLILLLVIFISIILIPAMSIYKFYNNYLRIEQDVFKLVAFC